MNMFWKVNLLRAGSEFEGGLSLVAVASDAGGARPRAGAMSAASDEGR